MATAMVTEAVVVLVVVGLGRAWPVLVQGVRPEDDPIEVAEAVARLLEGRRLASARPARHTGVRSAGVDAKAIAATVGHRRG